MLAVPDPPHSLLAIGLDRIIAVVACRPSTASRLPHPLHLADNNVFANNALTLASNGYGINIQTPTNGNTVYSNNTAEGAAKGLTNITQTP